ncbi:hypothetical protein E3N88_32796 [Mikania micrantha]|uniref:Uncharacterized protein n=1 Tax=Mikania micrantha TaxID=192012 RepID=A0A5N6MA28_9ASTR|nr:hypothetical protein E3N88_32796 [Mikania micrantha]
MRRSRGRPDIGPGRHGNSMGRRVVKWLWARAPCGVLSALGGLVREAKVDWFDDGGLMDILGLMPWVPCLFPMSSTIGIWSYWHHATVLIWLA